MPSSPNDIPRSDEGLVMLLVAIKQAKSDMEHAMHELMAGEEQLARLRHMERNNQMMSEDLRDEAAEVEAMTKQVRDVVSRKKAELANLKENCEGVEAQVDALRGRDHTGDGDGIFPSNLESLSVERLREVLEAGREAVDKLRSELEKEDRMARMVAREREDQEETLAQLEAMQAALQRELDRLGAALAEVEAVGAEGGRGGEAVSREKMEAAKYDLQEAEAAYAALTKYNGACDELDGLTRDVTQLEAGLGDAAPPRPVPTEVTAPASAAASAVAAIPEWTDQQEAEYSRLTQALAALNTELDEMRARVADLNAAVAKAARAVEVQKEETEDLSDQLEVARKLAQTLRKELQELEWETDHMAAMLDMRTTELRQLERAASVAAAGAAKELDQAGEGQANDAARAALVAEVRTLQAEVGALKAAVAEAAGKVTDGADEANDRERDAMETIEQLKMELMAMQEKLLVTRRDLEVVRHGDSSRASYASLVDGLQMLRDELTNMIARGGRTYPFAATAYPSEIEVAYEDVQRQVDALRTHAQTLRRLARRRELEAMDAAALVDLVMASEFGSA